MKFCMNCGHPVHMVTDHMTGSALIMGCRPCNAVYMECKIGHSINEKQPAWQKQVFTTLADLEKSLHNNRPFQA